MQRCAVDCICYVIWMKTITIKKEKNECNCVLVTSCSCSKLKRTFLSLSFLIHSHTFLLCQLRIVVFQLFSFFFSLFFFLFFFSFIHDCVLCVCSCHLLTNAFPYCASFVTNLIITYCQQCCYSQLLCFIPIYY